MSLMRPWLRRSHPNFFLIYMATLVSFAGFALLGLFSADSHFASPAYKYINLFASHEVWGAWAAATSVIMFIGLHFSNFRMARFGLGMGLCWMLLRFFFFAEAAWAGIPGALNGLPTYMLGALVLLGQTLEPPSNPASAKRRRGTSP